MVDKHCKPSPAANVSRSNDLSSCQCTLPTKPHISVFPLLFLWLQRSPSQLNGSLKSWPSSHSPDFSYRLSHTLSIACLPGCSAALSCTWYTVQFTWSTQGEANYRCRVHLGKVKYGRMKSQPALFFKKTCLPKMSILFEILLNPKWNGEPSSGGGRIVMKRDLAKAIWETWLPICRLGIPWPVSSSVL